jgi:hypothetical protein
MSAGGMARRRGRTAARARGTDRACGALLVAPSGSARRVRRSAGRWPRWSDTGPRRGGTARRGGHTSRASGLTRRGCRCRFLRRRGRTIFCLCRFRRGLGGFVAVHEAMLPRVIDDRRIAAQRDGPAAGISGEDGAGNARRLGCRCQSHSRELPPWRTLR